MNARIDTALAELTKTAGISLSGLKNAVVNPKRFALTREGLGTGRLTNNPLTFAMKAPFVLPVPLAAAAAAHLAPENGLLRTALTERENARPVSEQDVQWRLASRLRRKQQAGRAARQRDEAGDNAAVDAVFKRPIKLPGR
jgi:hypothetical protein